MTRPKVTFLPIWLMGVAYIFAIALIFIKQPYLFYGGVCLVFVLPIVSWHIAHRNRQAIKRYYERREGLAEIANIANQEGMYD